MPHGQFAPLLSLAAHWHSCEGDVPPPMVGASLTLVDSGKHAGHAYLFGGRLASTRKLTNGLYELNLRTLRWRKLYPGRKSSRATDDALPSPSSPSSASSSSSSSSSASASSFFPPSSSSKQPIKRYFHSCDLWKNKLVVFGGMGFHKERAEGELERRKEQRGSTTTTTAAEKKADPQASLFVLNEVIAYDLDTGEWDLHFDKPLKTAGPAAGGSELARGQDYEREQEEETKLPDPRYAHLSSMTGSSLIIIGGQSASNQYIQEINVFDLEKRKWTMSHQFLKMCGSYRSLAAGPRLLVKSPVRKEAISSSANGHAASLASTTGASSSLWATDSSKDANGNTSTSMTTLTHQPNSSMPASSCDYLPMSVRPASEHGVEQPLPVFVYSNYNFTDVKRELEVVRLPSTTSEALPTGRNRSASSVSQDSELDSEVTKTAAAAAGSTSSSRRGSISSRKKRIAIEDRSLAMTGTSFPPGLRFPTGAVLGDHFIISGTYLANTSQTFAIWALNTTTMSWTRLDVGSCLTHGSWNRAVLWPSQNRLVVFGNRQRDLVVDYNHRQSNFDDIVVIELEAWGIQQAPMRPVGDESIIRMGLEKLMASSVGSLAAAMGVRDSADDAMPPMSFGGRGDFEIVCSDGMRLGCDRVVLEKRWPWFLSKMREYKREARRVARTLSAASSRRRSDQLKAVLESEEEMSDDDDIYHQADKQRGNEGERKADPKVPLHRLLPLPGARGNDPRLLPRQLVIGEPAPVMLALLQFFYTRCICTALQRHPAVVAALLIAAKVYHLDELQRWAKHAAHVCLSNELAAPSTTATASGSEAFSSGETPTSATGAAHERGLPPLERHRLAVVIYETATMCGHEALQIRALRVVMSVSKWVQRTNAAHGRPSSASRQQALSHATTPTPISPNTVHGSHDTETSLMSPAVNETPAMASLSWSRTSRDDERAPAATGLPHSHSEIMMPPIYGSGEDQSDLDALDVRGANFTSSKIERMLGISSGQQYANGSGSDKAERMLGMDGGSTRQTQLHHHQQQQQPQPQSQYQQQPVLGSTTNRSVGQRRPSAATQASMLSVKTSSTGNSSRKRFSIFGRSTSEKLPPSPTVSERQLADMDGNGGLTSPDMVRSTTSTSATSQHGLSGPADRDELRRADSGSTANVGPASQAMRSTSRSGSNGQLPPSSLGTSSLSRNDKIPPPIQIHRRPSLAAKGSPRFRNGSGPSTPTSAKSGQLSENDKAILQKMSSFV